MPTCQLCGIQGKVNFGTNQLRKQFPKCKNCSNPGLSSAPTTPAAHGTRPPPSSQSFTLPPMVEVDKIYGSGATLWDASKPVHFTIYFDGSVQTERCGWATAVGFSGNNIGVLGTLPKYATSNQAEYFGLIGGLRRVQKIIEEKSIDPQRVGLSILGDSELILRQMNGDYKVNDPKLALLYQTAKSIFKQTSVEWSYASYQKVSREGNSICDGLARRAATTTAFDLDQIYIYYPNRCSLSKVELYGQKINATNDIMAALPNSYKTSFIDAAFLVKLPGFENELSNLDDPAPRFICRGSVEYAVLGIMRRPLVIKSDGFKNPISLQRVVVLFDFCVPFHWCLYNLVEYLYPITFSSSWKADVAFGKEYAKHTFHHTANRFMPGVEPRKSHESDYYYGINQIGRIQEDDIGALGDAKLKIGTRPLKKAVLKNCTICLEKYGDKLARGGKIKIRNSHNTDQHRERKPILLPDDIWVLVSRNLEVLDFLSLKATCRRFYKLLATKPIVLGFPQFKASWESMRPIRVNDGNRWSEDEDEEFLYAFLQGPDTFTAFKLVFQSKVVLDLDCSNLFYQAIFDFLVQEGLDRLAINLLKKAAVTSFAGVDPSSNDQYALIEACKASDLALVECLLDQKSVNPNHNDIDDRESSPMFLALQTGNDAIAERLLAHKGFDATSDGSFQYVQFAALFGRDHILSLFLRHPQVDPSLFVHPIFEAAAASRNDKVMKLVLSDSRIVMTQEDMNAIVLASERGLVEMVRMLLDDGRIDPSYNDHQALESSISNANREICQLLLMSPRVDLSASGNQFILLAAQYDQPEILSLLLERTKMDSFTGAQEVTRVTCDYGNWKCLQILLSPSFFKVFKPSDAVIEELIRSAAEDGFVKTVAILRKTQHGNGKVHQKTRKG